VPPAGTALPLVADVGHQEQLDGIVAELVAAHGPVDVLVSNAALASYEATTRASSRAISTGGSGSSALT